MFTKGEWKVEVHQDHTTVEADYFTVCADVSNDDANLIAAAPAMYKTLKVIVERHEQGLALGEKLELEPARQALAKVEGKDAKKSI